MIARKYRHRAIFCVYTENWLNTIIDELLAYDALLLIHRVDRQVLPGERRASHATLPRRHIGGFKRHFATV